MSKTLTVRYYYDYPGYSSALFDDVFARARALARANGRRLCVIKLPGPVDGYNVSDYRALISVYASEYDWRGDKVAALKVTQVDEYSGDERMSFVYSELAGAIRGRVEADGDVFVDESGEDSRGAEDPSKVVLRYYFEQGMPWGPGLLVAAEERGRVLAGLHGFDFTVETLRVGSKLCPEVVVEILDGHDNVLRAFDWESFSPAIVEEALEQLLQDPDPQPRIEVTEYDSGADPRRWMNIEPSDLFDALAVTSEGKQIRSGLEAIAWKHDDNREIEVFPVGVGDLIMIVVYTCSGRVAGQHSELQVLARWDGRGNLVLANPYRGGIPAQWREAAAAAGLDTLWDDEPRWPVLWTSGPDNRYHRYPLSEALTLWALKGAIRKRGEQIAISENLVDHDEVNGLWEPCSPTNAFAGVYDGLGWSWIEGFRPEEPVETQLRLRFDKPLFLPPRPWWG